MTKDELIALRRERGKQELNIGDRVKVYDRNGNIMYGGKTAIIIEKALLDPTEFYYGLYVEGETVDKFRGKGLLYLKNTATKIGKTALLAPFFAGDLELVKKPKPFVGACPLSIERAEKEMVEIASEITNNPEKAKQIQKEWEEAVSAKEKPTDKYGTITIPVKADFGEDVGFALLDRALELQKKNTELEGDIRRLYDWIMARKNNENSLIYAKFSNPYLECICAAMCDFRPLTEEEKKQRDAEFMIMIDNLKKQSE